MGRQRVFADYTKLFRMIKTTVVLKILQKALMTLDSPAIKWQIKCSQG